MVVNINKHYGKHIWQKFSWISLYACQYNQTENEEISSENNVEGRCIMQFYSQKKERDLFKIAPLNFGYNWL